MYIFIFLFILDSDWSEYEVITLKDVNGQPHIQYDFSIITVGIHYEHNRDTTLYRTYQNVGQTWDHFIMRCSRNIYNIIIHRRECFTITTVQYYYTLRADGDASNVSALGIAIVDFSNKITA